MPFPELVLRCWYWPCASRDRLPAAAGFWGLPSFRLASLSTGRCGWEVVRRRMLEMRVPGIQFSLSESPFSRSSLSFLVWVRTLGTLRGLPDTLPIRLPRFDDSNRPREETVRESLRLLSPVCNGTGVSGWSGELAKTFCFAERLRVNERRDRGRSNPEELLCGAVWALAGVDKALLASVSKTDSQLRGSRDRPKTLSFSPEAAARGVLGRIALLLLRSPARRGRRLGNMEIRFLDGEGSSSARMTAFPSEDMEIRRAFRPFGGDGVSSPSFRTVASPSKDKDNRSDGGDFSLDASASAEGASDASPRRSVTDRFLLAELGCGASRCVSWELCNGSGSGTSVGGCGTMSEDSDSKLVWELCKDCSGSSLSSLPEGSDSKDDCIIAGSFPWPSECPTPCSSTAWSLLSDSCLNWSATARGARSS